MTASSLETARMAEAIPEAKEKTENNFHYLCCIKQLSLSYIREQIRPRHVSWPAMCSPPPRPVHAMCSLPPRPRHVPSHLCRSADELGGPAALRLSAGPRAVPLAGYGDSVTESTAVMTVRWGRINGRHDSPVV
jgi:hypothetical protein